MKLPVLSLDEWLTQIGLQPHKIELGLDRVLEVGRLGELLHFSCPVVTIAGTNGKGSTVAILAKLLQEAGLQVGTYTSPHLIRFNERIQIGGQPATDQAIMDAFVAIEQLRDEIPLTYFEFTTLAAFYLFQQHLPKLDVLILEVGLGGRLDAVNVVDPSIAVVSSIHYDHQQYLGDTLEEIALEKGGIFRPKIPVVLGSSAQLPVLLEKASANDSPFYLEGEQFDYLDVACKQWRFQEKIIELPKSKLPHHSLSLALATYHLLRDNFLSLPEIGNITHVLSDKAMVARMQAFYHQGIELILDAGHNPQASQWLVDKLKKRSGRFFAVWASLSDKRLEDIVHPLFHKIAAWYVPDLPVIERSLPAEELSQLLRKQGATAVSAHSSPKQALQAALKDATKETCIVVFGSFYLVSEILSAIDFDKTHLENNGLYTSKESEK